jgi:flavin reductase (DIM6/NTAB) family NADH-FMN oxidoreductase RutF
MDIPWGSEAHHKFVTNVGLITSSGPHGDNIMAAEWTHHVSYSPGLVMVNIGYQKATLENIRETGEFGISIAAAGQSIISSVAGGSSGRDTDKIKALKELGFEFYKARKIDVLMVGGAAMNAEMKVVKIENMGDHAMVLGEVVALSTTEKEPIAYNKGKYWKLNEQIKKPGSAELEDIRRAVEESRKK